jgi:cytochrome b6-f complex iron-sulfur subunit
MTPEQTPSQEKTPSAPKPAAPAPAPAAAKVPEVTRRNFLWMGWAALVAFLGASGAAVGRFMFPNVIYEPSQKFNAGKASDYPLGVSLKWLSEQRVWIIRTPQGIYSLWARCTHLGCTPNWFNDQNRFRCPCHGSNYTIAGDVIAGPAPRPLWRPAVELASTGDLIIDKAILEDRPGLREKKPFFVELSGNA